MIRAHNNNSRCHLLGYDYATGKLLRICIWLLCLATCNAYAAEFIATVSSKQINVGQGIVLRLVLEDAKAVAPPDLSPLLTDFSILAQQQFSSYNSINGQVSSETGWDISLTAKHSGKITIPSIAINTNAGVLHSAAISITADQAQAQSTMHNLGISLAASISKNTTYVQEPIIYTLKIISYQPWVNRSITEIKSNDAIIEKVSEPKQYYQNYGGMHANIVELKYYITPMVPGKIKISAPVIQGEIQSPRFSNMLDYQPFTLKGDVITITAKPAAVKGKDWLPLQDLQITETWQGLDHAQEGDTITRKIKIVARGGFSSQLPDLQRFLEAKDLKIYANKPLMEDGIDPKTDILIGTKAQEFSIVARRAGTFTLPEIQIVWWNLRTNSKAIAKLPAKKITVHALGDHAGAQASNAAGAAVNQGSAVVAIPTSSANKLFYWIIGLLVTIIVILAGLVLLIWHRRFNVSADNSERIFKNPRQIRDAFTLKTHIIRHAQKKWQAPDNITLNDLGEYLLENGYQLDIAAYAALNQDLNEALYTNSNADLSSLIDQWLYVRKNVSKSSKSRRSHAQSKPLNPT